MKCSIIDEFFSVREYNFEFFFLQIMSEVIHTRKALEEVLRLADEKVVATNEYLKTKDREYKNYRKEWDNTNAEIDRYFNGLIRQLNNWKQVFNQLVADSYEKHENKYLSFKEELLALCSKTNISHDRRKTLFSQNDDSTIFTVIIFHFNVTQ